MRENARERERDEVKQLHVGADDKPESNAQSRYRGRA